MHFQVLKVTVLLCFKVSERKHNSKKMVKKKSCSSKCKTKKAAAQIASSEGQTPLDDPANITAISPELQTTSQGQLGFPDRVYLLASVIFQNNHLEKPAAHRLVNYGKERGLLLPEVKDDFMQRTAYELAFNTLKCEYESDFFGEVGWIS